MSTLRIVLGDQCSAGLSALEGIEPGDVVLMSEVMGECTYVKHHPKKIVLILSAMRHFAETLRGRQVRVDYIALDDPENTGSLRGEMLRAVARHGPARIVATEPGEWRLSEDMRHWHEVAGIETEIRDDTRSSVPRAGVSGLGAGQRSAGRRVPNGSFSTEKCGGAMGCCSMTGRRWGGKWNYDAENRKPPPKDLRGPPTPQFPPDAITAEVMALVAARFPSHFGDVEGFALPVTAEDAQRALDDFVLNRLPLFGDWQDTMKMGESTLYHALISTSLNCGLIDPLAACREAEAAFRAGRAPLNAVEGFIRQIIGWREFVRGVYWLGMPEYGQLNGLDAHRPLPWLYWSGETRMNCMHHAITDTKRHAYAHHIQQIDGDGQFRAAGRARPGSGR